MSEPETLDTLASPENPVDQQAAQPPAPAMSAAVRAEMDACQTLVDGIASLGFGVDMRLVQSRAEISGLCRVLVNSGIIPEETLQREIFASMRQILAATHQDCEVQLARMTPQERAAQIAGAAARKAALAEAEQSHPQQPEPSKNGKGPKLQVVRASDQLVIAKR